MNKVIDHFISVIVLSLLFFVCCSNRSDQQSISYDNWEVVWEEDFEDCMLDSNIWQKIPRGKYPWNCKMTSSEECYEIKDGILILRGIKNTILLQDSAEYLTGGITTKGKKNFSPGRFVVKAKLKGAEGAWPAIWLGAANKKTLSPYYAEIDIMERFHHKPVVYQTLHSTYTMEHKEFTSPNKVKSDFDQHDFNLYGVDIMADSIVFHVNNFKTLVYPRLLSESSVNKAQYPFYRDWYILIDMQLGGENVGKIKDEDLPAEMEIDWIKYYQLIE